MTITSGADYADSGVDWLGTLPAHWTVKPIKAVATLNDDVLSEATPPEFEIEYVEISDVAAGRGILGSTPQLFESAPSRARRRVADGDIIVSTVRTYLRAIASVENPPDNMVVSTGFAVIRPRAMHPTFLAYALEMDGFINQVIARSVGVSYPAINASELVRLPVPVPPSHEQAAIAAFLDRETGKIDALVEAQRRLIDLLGEKRQAVISHAVTKGLDPAAPMKDSGVEWLGAVPVHWEVRKLLTALKSAPCYGVLVPDDHPSGVPMMRITDMIGGTANPADFAMISPELSEQYGRTVLAQGDVALSVVGTIGNSLITDEALAGVNLSRAIARLQPNDTCSPSFMRWLFQSHAFKVFVDLVCVGTAQRVLNMDDLRAVRFAFPDRSEQTEIDAHLTVATAHIDTLSSQAGRAIELLKELRAAMISAAVTGKIDVQQKVEAPASVDCASARRLVGAAVLELVAGTPASSRMTSAKRMYLAETHAGVWELQGQPQRMAAGPFDGTLMAEVEAELARVGHIAKSQPGGPSSQVHYRLTGQRGALRAELDALLGDRRTAFDKMLTDLGNLESKGVEAVATLYAVWNDMLIDGKTPTDDAVIDGVLNDWHAEKREKFNRADLRNYLGWMRRHGLTPTGRGPRTKAGPLL